MTYKNWYISVQFAALGRTKKKQHLDEKARWERNAFNSNYAISKYLSEQEVWRGIAEGLNAAILNPSVILGAGFWDKGTPRLFQQAWNGLRFYPPGSTGFVDVRDVARLAILLMESEQSAQRFIANSSNIDYRTFFTEIAQAFKKRPPALLANSFLRECGWRLDWLRQKLTGGKRFLTKETARHTGRSYLYDNKKSIDLLNFHYTPIEQTIAETCQTFLSSQQNNSHFNLLPLNNLLT